ncbi:MAG: hypothetical protein ABSG15_09805 [FCB group bacterium]|jgi:hypothetical protein
MNRIIFLILFIFGFQVVFCQEASYLSYNNSFGIKYTNISGYGIYYDRAVSDYLNLQVMGLFYYLYGVKDNVTHKNYNYDIGLEIQENLIQGESGRVYFLEGGYYYLDDDRYDGKDSKNYIIDHSFNVGVGMSGQYYYKRFLLSLDIGYKFYEDRLETTNNTQHYPEIKRLMKLGLGIGIGFMF